MSANSCAVVSAAGTGTSGNMTRSLASVLPVSCAASCRDGPWTNTCTHVAELSAVETGQRSRHDSS